MSKRRISPNNKPPVGEKTTKGTNVKKKKGKKRGKKAKKKKGRTKRFSKKKEKTAGQRQSDQTKPKRRSGRGKFQKMQESDRPKGKKKSTQRQKKKRKRERKMERKKKTWKCRGSAPRKKTIKRKIGLSGGTSGEKELDRPNEVQGEKKTVRTGTPRVQQSAHQNGKRKPANGVTPNKTIGGGQGRAKRVGSHKTGGGRDRGGNRAPRPKTEE